MASRKERALERRRQGPSDSEKGGGLMTGALGSDFGFDDDDHDDDEDALQSGQ